MPRSCLSILTGSLLAGTALSQSALRGNDNLVGQPKGTDVWYVVDSAQGQHPNNFKALGGGKFQLSVKPYEEAVTIYSKDRFTSGKLSVRVRSAAVTPGVITSMYLASGDGRTSDSSLGKQDEIDLEWKGNDPTRVQSNVFLQGVEDLQLLDVGDNSSALSKLYGLAWDDKHVTFSIDGNVMRTKYLDRPLQPMRLKMSVWTTMGGWPGLIQWGGSPDWDSRKGSPATALFEVLELPKTGNDVTADSNDVAGSSSSTTGVVAGSSSSITASPATTTTPSTTATPTVPTTTDISNTPAVPATTTVTKPKPDAATVSHNEDGRADGMVVIDWDDQDNGSNHSG